MTEGQYEREEYLDQNDDEREDAGRFKSLIALAVLGVLVIAGIVLVNQLRSVSRLQECLMTRATNCAEITTPPPAQR
jgi:hypothetical protein